MVLTVLHTLQPRPFFPFQSMGCRTTHDNRKAVAESDVVLVCVKPGVMSKVLEHVASSFDPSSHLLASVALGVPISALEAPLPTGSRVMRLMPNTPALVQQGASVFTRGTHATSADAQLTHRLVLLS